MLLDPRLPVFVGVTLTGALMWTLYEFAPSPGELSEPHSRLGPIQTQASCRTCHAEEGLAEGCLGCHTEIAAQFHDSRGYHAAVTDRGAVSCSECHLEHYGAGSPLVSDRSWGDTGPEAFAHGHVEFGLTGGHAALECADCHVAHREQPFALDSFPDLVRTHTFLGLTQTCGACHDDPHADGLAADCNRCHGQEQFAPPAQFDHGHLPLAGGHAELECRECHELPAAGVLAGLAIPAPPAALEKTRPMNDALARFVASGGAPGVAGLPAAFPFHATRGQTCGECHESPHRVEFDESCADCHEASEAIWRNGAAAMTAARHARTGFPLTAPHDQVACSACHADGEDFDGRHPDPTDPAYLRTPDTCRGCHADTHEGQFAGRYDECLDCHGRLSFLPTTFSHQKHSDRFPLTGAHLAIDCTTCHEPDAVHGTRQFTGTTHDCRGCHDSPHAGQFAAQIAAEDCSHCHRTRADTFHVTDWDHTARTGFALEGAHAGAACAACHREVEYPLGDTTVRARRFEDTPQECAECHVDVHRGQFEHWNSCADCHTSQDTWWRITFDHNTQTRFPLIGKHRSVKCNDCHRPIQKDGRRHVQFRPLGRECRDCHEIDPTSIQWSDW